MLQAVTFVDNFERAVVRDAKRRGVAGVICGHIHTPALKEIDGMTYINCGDWVDNCTAVTEHFDGRMELVRWTAAAEVIPDAPALAVMTDD
jgi:UDP-2,3-diacylglucosamine pyrophosphatase LpxH